MEMDLSNVRVTASARLPLRTFEAVAQFARQRGLVKRTGEPNTSRALVALVEAGLVAESEQKQEVAR